MSVAVWGGALSGYPIHRDDSLRPRSVGAGGRGALREGHGNGGRRASSAGRLEGGFEPDLQAAAVAVQRGRSGSGECYLQRHAPRPADRACAGPHATARDSQPSGRGDLDRDRGHCSPHAVADDLDPARLVLGDRRLRRACDLGTGEVHDQSRLPAGLICPQSPGAARALGARAARATGATGATRATCAGTA